MAVNVLVLAAGYGTRLAKDIASDSTGKYEHLAHLPKPLLPIGDVPLLSRWMRIFSSCVHVGQVYIVINELFRPLFEKWAKDFSNVHLVSDGSTCNENRLGAIGAMKLALDHFGLSESAADTLVVGGDTLFYSDFSLSQVLVALDQLKSTHPASSMVLAYVTNDDGAARYGILEIDDHSRVVAFLEKPGAHGTASRLACPCFYVFSPAALKLVPEFLSAHADGPLEARDAPGNFVRFLQAKLPVFVHTISGRFDVGGLASYEQCDQYFRLASSQ